MNTEQMLQMLKIDLGITTEIYDERLGQYIQTAQAEIEREGASLTPSSSVPDATLIISYAAWMWRKRDTGEGIPRMLRWQINNRLFGGELNG